MLFCFYFISTNSCKDYSHLVSLFYENTFAIETGRRHENESNQRLSNRIGSSAFSRCTGLTSINQSTFNNCTSLATVTIGSSGVTSAFSAVVSRTCDCAQPKITVTNRASDGKPVVTWEAFPGAVKYEVYRATSKDGTYSHMYTTTATSYVNTLAVAGNTYYYKVRAIHSNSGANSAYSGIKHITAG